MYSIRYANDLKGYSARTHSSQAERFLAIVYIICEKYNKLDARRNAIDGVVILPFCNFGIDKVKEL